MPLAHLTLDVTTDPCVLPRVVALTRRRGEIVALSFAGADQRPGRAGSSSRSARSTRPCCAGASPASSRCAPSDEFRRPDPVLASAVASPDTDPRPTLGDVDALARGALAAKRTGRSPSPGTVSPALFGLCDALGLVEVLGLEARRQAEALEQAAEDVVMQSGDPPARRLDDDDRPGLPHPGGRGVWIAAAGPLAETFRSLEPSNFAPVPHMNLGTSSRCDSHSGNGGMVNAASSRGSADAVDAVGLADVLAQQADRRLGHGERVGGVDAELGEGRRVRGLAVVVDVDVRRRRGTGMRSISVGAGCTIIAACDAVEHALVEHDDLAAAAFLGRGAEDLDGDAEVVGQRRERQAGADRGGGDDVVATRMADAGQRVVLGADADGERARCRAWRRRRSAGRPRRSRR